jgi:hypothetical protein
MYNSERIEDIKRILNNDEVLFEAFNSLYEFVSQKYSDLYVICNTNYMTINSSKKGNIYSFQRTDKDKLFLTLNKRKFIFKASDLEKYYQNFLDQYNQIVEVKYLYNNEMKLLQKNIMASYNAYIGHEDIALIRIIKFETSLKKFYDSLIIHYATLSTKFLEPKELELFRANVIANKNFPLETNGHMNNNFNILNKAKDKMRGKYTPDLLLRLKCQDLIPFLAYLKNINFRFFKLVIEQFVLIETQYDEVLSMISNVNNAYYQKKLEEAK